jgi:regulator of protease activity HflC (stomatin/prohibitin superfamily)
MDLTEKRTFRIPGFLMVLVLLAVVAALMACGVLLGARSSEPEPYIAIALMASSVVVLLVSSGFVIVNPNEARVVQFFGRYIGTVRTPGFHWVTPLTTKRKITLRVRNFETARLKVSDADGNPVEIAAVVVFRVVDSAKAVFAVDDHAQYVAVQAEAAVRHLATSYPYESHDGRPSLRDSGAASQVLTSELRERVELAGVEVLESRVTHLAYAPEIAQAMLVRQQANAVVAARAKIVEGAVGMVRGALDQLAELNVVTLDEERKAQMVSNLLVVLCADRATQPVINTGTLYG